MKYDVCHINSNFEKFNLDFMSALKDEGITYRVFYFREIERGLPDVNEEYLDIRLNFNQWNRYFFYLKERKVLNDFENLYDVSDFKIIHAHTLFSNGFVAFKLFQKYGIPYVVSVRSVDLEIFFKYRINLRKIGIDILRNASKIIFISPSLKGKLFEKYIKKQEIDFFEEKSVIIPNGMNDYFLDNKPNENIIEEKNKKSIKILTIGRIYKRKNQLLVAKSLQKFIEKYPELNIKYTIIGQINDKNYFERVIEYEFVEYIPFSNKVDLIEHYRNSTIFVMPSLSETFGLVYVEAMSQGLPVIYSKNQGIDGFFNEGEIGYRINEYSTDEIVGTIENILENYDSIALNALKHSQEFNWGSIANQYSNIYRGLIRQL